MRVSAQANQLNPDRRRVCLAIGFFDGVHLGHQQILRHTLTDARQHGAEAVAITFDRHPNTVLAPARVPPQIYSLRRKLKAIEEVGMDAALLIHFDKHFSEKSGEEFVRELARDLGSIWSICVGADFVFGHHRGGNVELLRKLGAELGFSVHALAAVSLDRQVIRSTRIRQAIIAGDLEAAGQMLGRTYSLSGTVRRGDGLGRKLGFPTANIDTTGLAVPPKGVYAAQARAGGRIRPAVVNIGSRPTLAQLHPELRVEAHLLEFAGDLYAAELEILFLEKLRDEKKFDSLDALGEQIGRDVAEAKKRF